MYVYILYFVHFFSILNIINNDLDYFTTDFFLIFLKFKNIFLNFYLNKFLKFFNIFWVKLKFFIYFLNFLYILL